MDENPFQIEEQKKDEVSPIRNELMKISQKDNSSSVNIIEDIKPFIKKEIERK